MSAQSVQEIQAVIKALVDAEKLAKQIAADKKVSPADIPLALSFFSDLPSALANVGNIGNDVKSLSEEEIAQVVAYAVSDLGITNQKILDIIKASLKILFDAVPLVQAIQEPAAPSA